MTSSQQDTCLYKVTIKANILSASSQVRFPCFFTVTWKTNDLKICLQTGRHSTVQGKADLNESLTMTTDVGFDKTKNQFIKKDTQIQLNLISKSRLEQPKLVGRISIDLATILTGQYSIPSEFQLQFCSVNGILKMSFDVVEKCQSKIQWLDLQRSVGEASGSRGNLSTIRERGDNLGAKAPSSGSFKMSQTTGNFFKNFATSPQDIGTKSNSSAQKEQKISISPAIPKQMKVALSELQAPQIRSGSRSIWQAYSPKNSQFSVKLSELIVDDPPTCKNQTTSIRRYDSIQSSQSQSNQFQSRINEQLDRKKVEYQKLKYQNDRHRQEEDRYRHQLQKNKQQNDMVKLQLRQKLTLLDQTTNQLNSLKGDIAKMREDTAKKMNESVGLALNVAQLKEANNKLTVQLAANDRQLRRLQGINVQLQQSQGAKGELSTKLCQLRNKNEQLSYKCQQLAKQKNQLQETIIRLGEQNSHNSQKLIKKESEFSEDRQTLIVDIQNLKQQLKLEGYAKKQLQFQIGDLEKEIKQSLENLNKMSEDRNTWERQTQKIHMELGEKHKRVQDLQQIVLNLGEKIKQLEEECTTSIQALQQKDQQLIKLTKQKANTDKQLQTAKTDLQDSKNEGLALLSQLEENKLSLSEMQNERDVLHSDVISLQQKYNKLKTQHQQQADNLLKVTIVAEQTKLKVHEMEELLITTNEHKNKELAQSAENQNQLKLRVAELQGQISRICTLLEGSQQKLIVLEDQLKGRENLIVRLQQGLKSQVERSESLNNRLMGYMQRQQKTKQVISIFEQEYNKFNELLIEQQLRDKANYQILKDRDSQIYQLITQLQFKDRFASQMENARKYSEQVHSQREDSLNQNIQQLLQNNSQLQNSIHNQNAEINKLQNNIAQLNQTTQQQTANLHASHSQYCQNLQSQIEQMLREYNQLQTNSANIKNQLQQKQNKIQQLQNAIASKQSQALATQMKFDDQHLNMLELQKELSLVGQSGQKSISENKQKYLQLQQQYARLQNQFCQKTAEYQQQIEKITEEYEDLKYRHNQFACEHSNFDLNRHKLEIREKEREISKMDQYIKKLEVEVAKVQNLERTLKIKTIQLNSFKFKGKLQGIQENQGSTQLVKLKDQEIASLIQQKDRLLGYQYQAMIMKEKIDALHVQMQLLQQQKFNIESVNNQKNFALNQARQQNRKLTEEIQIIGQRNGELQRTLQALLSKQLQQSETTTQLHLKAQNLLLKNQLREVQMLRKKITDVELHNRKIEEELDVREEKHMVDLIDQQLKLAKSESFPSSSSISLRKSMQLTNQNNLKVPNMNYTYKSLKELLQMRAKNKVDAELAQKIDALLSQEHPSRHKIQEKARLLSKQLQKLKLQLLKSGGAQQRTKWINAFKLCESAFGQTMILIQGLPL